MSDFTQQDVESMGAILNAVAEALYGPPAPGRAHGWADLGQRVRTMKSERDAAGMALDSMTARWLAVSDQLAEARAAAGRAAHQAAAPVFTESPPVGECVNPYTCRLLRRIDAVIWRLRGKRVGWSKDGTLCEIYPKGHGGELPSVFPGRLFVLAADIQNRWRWTRKVLSR